MEITIKVYKMHREGKTVREISKAVSLSTLEVEQMIKNFA